MQVSLFNRQVSATSLPVQDEDGVEDRLAGDGWVTLDAFAIEGVDATRHPRNDDVVDDWIAL